MRACGFLLVAACMAVPALSAEQRITADLCVYGGTSAGVVAAVQMTRLGGTAVIVEPGRHLGGLTAGGLGQTDVGNSGAVGGMAREFYDEVLTHYTTTYGPDSDQVKKCNSGFRFEPHVAEDIFNRWAEEAGVPVFFEERLDAVRKGGSRIREIVTESGLVVRAKCFIDATYEGDLMARAGVSYTFGREPAARYRERYNGIQFGHPHHNFNVPVDPYVIEGDPTSGLLPGIHGGDPGRHGDGDDRIQAYNFRMCLTNDPGNRIPFPKPEGYDPKRYTLLARYINAGVFDAINLSTPMPNSKTDTNNHGGFSTDNIGMNYDYPDGDYATRKRIIDEHRAYQQGLMWFLCNDERVPKDIRDRVGEWGLPKDEFTDNGGWPHHLYIREARRMISDYVMTENDCMSRKVADDAVGLASYTMDSHNCQRFVDENGWARNEGDVQIRVPKPFPVAYRSIRPKRSECTNLLVPICLSSSHIAFGSIRMEPVFMVLGQSASTAARLAMKAGCAVQDVDYEALQEQLLADGQTLEWTGGSGGSTRAPEIRPESLPGIVIDDQSGEKTGQWMESTAAGNRRVGTGYIHDGDAGKGKTSIRYTFDIPEAGRYELFLISPPHENRAPNVPVSVIINGETVETVAVDQRIADRNGYASLGFFDLPRGKLTQVLVSNAGTDGHVVADGVQAVPVEE